MALVARRAPLKPDDRGTINTAASQPLTLQLPQLPLLPERELLSCRKVARLSKENFLNCSGSSLVLHANHSNLKVLVRFQITRP